MESAACRYMYEILISFNEMYHSLSTPYLFSFGETHPQFESLDEELHHLIVLRFNGWTVKLSLLIPKGQSVVVAVEETFQLNTI